MAQTYLHYQDSCRKELPCGEKALETQTKNTNVLLGRVANFHNLCCIGAHKACTLAAAACAGTICCLFCFCSHALETVLQQTTYAALSLIACSAVPNGQPAWTLGR